MALLTRARGMALAGATALAVVLPISPMAPAPAASAVPAPRVSLETSAASVVSAEERKKKTSRSSRSFAVRSAKVMRTGNSLKGVPYRYGGSTPRGFDCSGFTSYVYRKAGVSLPRRASAQRAKARRISRSSARAGDLVFFHNSSGRVYHVGIYAGGNRTLHSGRPGTRVSTVNIWTRNVSFGRAL
jgi:cell wall-associated NlpC family hydrolase